MDEQTASTGSQRASSGSDTSHNPQPETEASLILKASTNSYPFLVHSTDTLANNRPPNVDNKPLARQKRRRTSPEDQKILEEAYAKNPKPDKATRMDIVSRVALGEKEVQIWFQNRRQSSRRKSKPLEPHEIAQYQSTYSSPFDGPVAERHAEGSHRQDDEAASQLHDKSVPSASQNASASFVEVPSSQPEASTQDSASKAGYLSNRRNNASFTAINSQDAQPDSQEPPTKRLRKSDSKIRLSMTADGVARVMEGDELSSPPRKMPPPMTASTGALDEPDSQSMGLHRTQSDISLDGYPGSQESSTSLRRKPSGRSRDSRVWSFFADRGARSELEERAKQETSGDAAEAISILRQQEKDRARNPLMRVPSLKRLNPQPMSSEDRAVKRLRQSQSFTAPSPSSAPSQPPATTPFRQPLLQRSSSARNMPASNRRTTHHDPLLLAKTPKLKQTPAFEIAATDSDKENWSPADRPSAFMDRHFLHQMQTSPAVMPSTVRRPRAHAGFHETPAPRNRGKHASRTQVEHFDDDDDDEDVMQFMGQPPSSSVRKEKVQRGMSEREERQSSEEEDLDCVQGLLKLSQGNWTAAR